MTARFFGYLTSVPSLELPPSYGPRHDASSNRSRCSTKPATRPTALSRLGVATVYLTPL